MNVILRGKLLPRSHRRELPFTTERLPSHLPSTSQPTHHAVPSAMSIRQLPEDVVDKLKSSVAITSLNGVATGLLNNSLDAAATKIHISLDYAKGNCTVDDNGHGIIPAEFTELGGLGKLHCEILHRCPFPPADANSYQIPRGSLQARTNMDIAGTFLLLWLVCLSCRSPRSTMTTSHTIRS